MTDSQSMDVVLMGEADGEPFYLVPPLALNHRVLPGPVSKSRVENLQAFNVLGALTAVNFFGDHTVEVLEGADPPDRYLQIGGRRFGLELTTITAEQLRGRLARVRRLARLLQEALEQGAHWPHLKGRFVHLFDDPGGFRGDPITVAEQIAKHLEADKGYQGEGIDFTHGSPEQYPNDRGFYGEVGSIVVTVMQGDGSSPVQVVAGSQGEVTRAAVRELVIAQIREKDRAGNDIVLLTAGLVDSSGYVCPLDQWLFMMLRDHGLAETLQPAHIKAVLVHNWSTNEVLCLHGEQSIQSLST